MSWTDDLRWLLRHEEGRRFAYALTHEWFMHGKPFDLDSHFSRGLGGDTMPLMMARTDGIRWAAGALLEQLRLTEPDLYIKMIREGLEAERLRKLQTKG